MKLDHATGLWGAENLPFGQIAVKREATFTVEDYLREQEEYWKPVLIDGKEVNYLSLFKDKLQFDRLGYDLKNISLDRYAFKAFQKIRVENIKNRLFKNDAQIFCINHHLAHSFYGIGGGFSIGGLLPISAFT